MSVTPDEPDEPRRGERVPPEGGESPPPPPYGQVPPAPRPYGEPPPSGQPPPHGQAPPYGQVPPDEQPPSYGPYGYDSGAGYGGVRRPSTKATAALILSIIGLLLCPFLFSVIGLVLASQAKREIAASGGGLTGAGFAQAAFVISIIGLVFWVLGLILSAAGIVNVNVPGA